MHIYEVQRNMGTNCMLCICISIYKYISIISHINIYIEMCLFMYMYLYAYKACMTILMFAWEQLKETFCFECIKNLSSFGGYWKRHWNLIFTLIVIRTSYITISFRLTLTMHRWTAKFAHLEMAKSISKSNDIKKFSIVEIEER